MKFFNLFKKELKEMFNANMVLSLVVSFVLLVLLGQFMQSSFDSMSESSSSVTICDLDQTELTSSIVQGLEDVGYTVEKVAVTDSTDDLYISQQTDSNDVLIIPKGFTDSIYNGEVATIKDVGKVESNSVMSQMSTVYTTAIYDISEIVKNLLIEEKSNFDTQYVEFLNDPIDLDEVTVVGDKSADVSSSSVSSMITSQGSLVPMIIFVIIVFASQMIVTAIATEKTDKTLETLLSTPISRVSILTAKMLSAGLVALISAVVYMLGFSISMGSVMVTSTELVSDTVSSTVSTQFAMLELGLVLTPTDYVLIGVDIFLSIMIALSLSMMLGVMVSDIKSTQLVMMPVMFMAIIPYLISYFVDINSLSPVAKVILNLIPFTHTFNATNNLMFDNTSTVVLGVVYQLVVLVVCMFFAVRLFQSDKILTASFNFGRRSKKSANL